MAGRSGGPLIPVLAWTPPGGELADRRCPSPHLRKIWSDAAARRLGEALDDAGGGSAPDRRGVAARGRGGRAGLD